MQIKEGKKGIYTNKIYSKFKWKKRKIRVNCKSGTIKKCNKQTKLKNKKQCQGYMKNEAQCT